MLFEIPSVMSEHADVERRRTNRFDVLLLAET